MELILWLPSANGSVAYNVFFIEEIFTNLNLSDYWLYVLINSQIKESDFASWDFSNFPV